MFRKCLWSAAVVVGVLAGSQSVWAQGRPPIYVPPVPVLPPQQPNWNWQPITPLPDLRPTLPVTYPVPVIRPAARRRAGSGSARGRAGPADPLLTPSEGDRSLPVEGTCLHRATAIWIKT